MALRIGKPHFRVGEFEGGVPYVIVEPQSGDNLVMHKGHVSFRLPSGISLERAQEIVQFLRDNIVAIAEQD